MNSYSFQSPIGFLKICEEKEQITQLFLQAEQDASGQLQKFISHSDLLYEAYHQLNEYFLGKRKKFALPINSAGTTFQQQVWKELQGIPYGETRSYEHIAVSIGRPKAARAIGQANNRNPVLILIPCHRVIHKNGDITGFACGMEAKKYLLDLEKGNR